ATDAVSLASPFIGRARNILGPVGAALSVANDRSPVNDVSNLLPYLVPETGIPLAAYGAAEDGSAFVANHIVKPVFTPDALQSDTMNDGNGHTIAAPNAFDWHSI